MEKGFGVCEITPLLIYPVRYLNRPKQKKEQCSILKDPSHRKTFFKLASCHKYLQDSFLDFMYPKHVSFATNIKRNYGEPIRVINNRKNDKTFEHRTYYKPPPLYCKKENRSHLEKMSLQNYYGNHRSQYPLSTVTVRWHNSDYYTQITLLRTLCPYGDIDNIVITSPYSANIVFSNLCDACRLVSARVVGSQQTQLFCYWYHNSLNDKYISKSGQQIKVYNKELPHFQM